MAGVDQNTAEGVWTSRLLERHRLADSTFELRLSRPAGFRFQPGQRITLQHGRHARDYTLANALEDDVLTVLVRLIPTGQVTPLLDQMPIGTELGFTGPAGRFRFQPSHRPAVMIATGTGIAPFVAMIRAGVKPFMLLHGVRTKAELYYREELAATTNHYIPCLSKAPPGHGEAFHGYVTHFLQTRRGLVDCDFYLAGRMEMIHGAIQIIDAGFAGARVFTEAFF
jgi:ferredoxin-NADP reductase